MNRIASHFSGLHTAAYVLLLFLFFHPSPLLSQSAEGEGETVKKKGSLSITFGTAAGNFDNSASNFNSIYSNRSISRIYFAGIGNRTFYFIARYREFYANGRSTLENIAVTGRAEWKQKFYAGGLRMKTEDQPVYVDILYVVTRAEEYITTSDPVVEELTSRYETENKGIGFAVGVALKLIGPIGIFLEGDYYTMMKKGRNPLGRVNPELGGFTGSAGVHFTL